MDPGETFIQVVGDAAIRNQYAGYWWHIGIACNCKVSVTVGDRQLHETPAQTADRHLSLRGFTEYDHFLTPSTIPWLLEALSVCNADVPRRCFAIVNGGEPCAPNFEVGLRSYLDDFWRIQRRYTIRTWSWHDICVKIRLDEKHLDPAGLEDATITFRDLFDSFNSQWHSPLAKCLYGSSVVFEQGMFDELYQHAEDIPSGCWVDIIQCGRMSGQIGPCEEEQWKQLILRTLNTMGPKSVIPSIYCFLNTRWKSSYQVESVDVDR